MIKDLGPQYWVMKSRRQNNFLVSCLLPAIVPRMLLQGEGVEQIDHSKGKGGKSGGDELVKIFQLIHDSCNPKDAAPRRYMTFLKTYKAVFNEKKDGVVKRQQHLQVPVITQHL